MPFSIAEIQWEYGARAMPAMRSMRANQEVGELLRHVLKTNGCPGGIFSTMRKNGLPKDPICESFCRHFFPRLT